MENFNHQVYAHKTSLQSYAFNYTKNIEDAEDLVQDTMMKAMKYANLYAEGTNLGAWLFTILKNTFINNYKRITKKNLLIETTDDLTSHQLVKGASFNQVENMFINDDLQNALSHLEPSYYIPFIKYFEGYKYHEIADDLNIPIGTVKTRIHVARQVLKGKLKMYNQEFSKSNLHN
jgi:RNA polymerase sigma factor (sigma-70 family)